MTTEQLAGYVIMASSIALVLGLAGYWGLWSNAKQARLSNAIAAFRRAWRSPPWPGA